MITEAEFNSLSEISLLRYKDEICSVYWIDESLLVLYTQDGPREVKLNDPALSLLSEADKLAHRLSGRTPPYSLVDTKPREGRTE